MSGAARHSTTPNGTPDTLSEVGEAIAVRVEEVAEERGWDQPATLYEIYGEDVPAELVDRFLEAKGARPDGDYLTVAFGVAETGILDGHPAHALVGQRSQQESVLGAVLVSEGWNYPPDVMEEVASGKLALEELPTPSEHPRRVEVRIVTAVFRDGTQRTVMRNRGESAHVWKDGANLQGRLVRALKLYLGIPSAELPPTQPKAVLADILARAGAVLVNEASSLETLGPTGRQNLIETLIELSPIADNLGDNTRQGLYQMLSGPLGLPMAIQAPPLWRETWEGYYADLRAQVDRFVKSAGGRERNPDWKEWRRWLEWADEAMVAWDLIDRLQLPYWDVNHPKAALKWFNTRLLENPAPPDYAPIVNLYRKQLQRLAEEIAG